MSRGKVGKIAVMPYVEKRELGGETAFHPKDVAYNVAEVVGYKGDGTPLIRVGVFDVGANAGEFAIQQATSGKGKPLAFMAHRIDPSKNQEFAERATRVAGSLIQTSCQMPSFPRLLGWPSRESTPAEKKVSIAGLDFEPAETGIAYRRYRVLREDLKIGEEMYGPVQVINAHDLEGPWRNFMSME